MGCADKTAVCQEMAAVKVGNHTHAADVIGWFVSHIDCLCQWQLVNCFPMILNSRLGVVMCHIGHPE